MTALLAELFPRLPGAWRVRRVIDDAQCGAGRFDGEAQFTLRGENALLCVENGELSLGAWRGPAYRSWLYAGEANAISIFYPDGRTLLHRFDFAAGSESAAHLHVCGEDRYQAVLSCTGAAAFVLAYTIDGPAKHCQLHTAYARLS